MNYITVVSVLVLLLQVVKRSQSKSEVCYRIGGETICYTNGAPFNNAGGSLPESPEDIDTKFYLYDIAGGQLTSKELNSEAFSTLKQNTATKFIVHGYTQSRNVDWINEMVTALKNAGDYNVIVVDWNKGCSGRYLPAVANCRVVGYVIAHLIKALEVGAGIQEEQVHIIGHSLGAHIAGYAGKLLPRLGRITGLDPAGPAFTTDNSLIRLSSTDATFVDAIHTDNGVFGLTDAVGKADFFVNTGKSQPGCPTPSSIISIFQHLTDFAEKVGCSHFRVVHLYTKTISNVCNFQSKPCEEGTVCDTCGASGCVRMGFHSDADSASGSYYTPTTDTDPFC